MVLGRGGPWLFSLGLHLVACVLVFFVITANTRPPQVGLRMHLGPSAGTASFARFPAQDRPGPWVAPGPGVAPLDEPLPPGGAWTLPSEPGVLGIPAPASLDEILGALPEAASPVDSEPALGAGWSGPKGEGYVAPPLPEPRLVPPQGASWSLAISVPGSGGPAHTIEGTDSGHPDLDRWLEDYLRTLSFPAHPLGEDYQLRWDLRLVPGRPR